MMTTLQTSELQACAFCIGGVSLRFSSGAEAVAVPRSLAMFRVQETAPDIAINVEWVPELPRSLGVRVFDSGCTWKLHDLGSDLQFDFYVGAATEKPHKRLVTDGSFSVANLQISEEAGALGLSVVPLDYPLDELLIMHRLTQEKAIELHGTGIVRPNGEANLFVGHSGAGKSTTTRLWTAIEDVEVLSDDRIIVRRDEQPRMVPSAETLFGAPSASLRISARSSDAAQAPQLRLRDRSAVSIGHSAQDEKQIPRFARNDKKHKMRMYGTPWHGDAMFASPNNAPLTRIFVLEHGHGNVITPLNPSQAVAELFARSFVPFHRHEYVDSALVFLEELVDAVPVYRYAFEPDLRAVENLLHFRD